MDSCGIDGVESEQQTGERPQKMPLTTAAKQIRPNSALSTASNLPHAHIVEVAAREFAAMSPRTRTETPCSLTPINATGF
jgi:hypothetical protein